jgi:hypothetical protein
VQGLTNAKPHGQVDAGLQEQTRGQEKGCRHSLVRNHSSSSNSRVGYETGVLASRCCA